MPNTVDSELLRLTIPHHEQGVKMGELAAGEFDDLKEMARSAHQKQTDEVREMGSMLVQMSKAKEALS